MTIPQLKNTQEALDFGRSATQKQREELLKMRRHYLAVSDKAIARGDYQEALDAACAAQLYREALEASGNKENKKIEEEKQKMRCSDHHYRLDKNGEGKCSVPMWQNGFPNGFCDKTAYGKPTPCEEFRDRDGKLRRTDGKYNGYVPGLACTGHGGPRKPKKEVLIEK